MLIDKGDAFVFGFSKLEVMFGRRHAGGGPSSLPRSGETGRAIPAYNGAFVRSRGAHGGDGRGRICRGLSGRRAGRRLDPAATPGLVEGGNEFYTVPGAFAMRDVIARFERGPAIIGVCGKSFKCPPAPSETALLLHDYLTARGRREATEITVVIPFGVPIPPSPETSQAILAAFAERGIRFVKDSLVRALDPARKVAVLSDGTEIAVRAVSGRAGASRAAGGGRVRAGGRCVQLGAGEQADAGDGFPRVYAVGDVNGVGTPKAGVFAEGAARAVAASIVAQLRARQPAPYRGVGSCYLEFGSNGWGA